MRGNGEKRGEEKRWKESRERRVPERREAMLKMADLCARSEHCRYEIEEKLLRRGLSREDAESIADELTERGFISEERYARSFTNDKVRFSGWGRYKIKLHLKAKRISDRAVREALTDIDPEEYGESISRVLRQKARDLDMNKIEDRRKLYRFGASRGFEGSLIVETIRRIVDEQK